MDLMRYLKENMVFIPEGQELIRDFVDPIKWMSSDYKMSIPGTKKEKIVKEELVMIQSFLLLKTPVTNELYHYTPFSLEYSFFVLLFILFSSFYYNFSVE